MTIEEKYIARILFKIKTMSSNGQAFQDLFSQVMRMENPEFRVIKPYGNFGDRKNDGYEKNLGKYYQVYAPESITPRYTVLKAINKCKVDFKGLIGYWNSLCAVKDFYFVLNDKYEGTPAEIEGTLLEIEGANVGVRCHSFCAKDLEDVFLSLRDDNAVTVVGLIPSADSLGQIDYEALKEVVGFLISNKRVVVKDEIYTVPVFEDKIKFNGLSNQIYQLLLQASYQVSVLDDYFQNNSTFLKANLKDIFINLYEEGKVIYKDDNDLIFFHILKKAAVDTTRAHIQDAVLILMSYYFESCDIFEEPK